MFTHVCFVLVIKWAMRVKIFVLEISEENKKDRISVISVPKESDLLPSYEDVIKEESTLIELFG